MLIKVLKNKNNIKKTALLSLIGLASSCVFFSTVNAAAHTAAPAPSDHYQVPVDVVEVLIKELRDLHGPATIINAAATYCPQCGGFHYSTVKIGADYYVITKGFPTKLLEGRSTGPNIRTIIVTTQSGEIVPLTLTKVNVNSMGAGIMPNAQIAFGPELPPGYKYPSKNRRS